VQLFEQAVYSIQDLNLHYSDRRIPCPVLPLPGLFFFAFHIEEDCSIQLVGGLVPRSPAYGSLRVL